jgi:hypothetical protein
VRFDQEGLAAPTARRWMAKSSAFPDQPQSHRTTLVRALYSSIRCDFTGRSGVCETAVRTGRAMISPPSPVYSTSPSRAAARRDRRNESVGAQTGPTPMGARSFYQSRASNPAASKWRGFVCGPPCRQPRVSRFGPPVPVGEPIATRLPIRSIVERTSMTTDVCVS